MRRVSQFLEAVVKHWGVLVTGGFAIGVLGIWQGTGHPVRPWVYWIVAIVGFFVASFKAWNDQVNETEKALTKIAEIQRELAALPRAPEWQALASRFEKLPNDLRADWNRGSDGIESWRICGGARIEECESLCQLAGAMLLRSANVAVNLSEAIRSESDQIYRWLYFLKETQRGLRDYQYGLEQEEDGTKKPFYYGSIRELARLSYTTCIKCSVVEV